MTWLDVGALLGGALAVAGLALAVHPSTRPLALRAGRALWWAALAALGLLSILALSRRRRVEPAPTPAQPSPGPLRVAQGYVERIEADRAHAARGVEAEAADDDLEELARLEREARARAGLPPA